MPPHQGSVSALRKLCITTTAAQSLFATEKELGGTDPKIDQARNLLRASIRTTTGASHMHRHTAVGTPSPRVAAAADSRPDRREFTANTREGASLAVRWLLRPHAMQRAVTAPCRPAFSRGDACSATSAAVAPCMNVTRVKQCVAHTYTSPAAGANYNDELRSGVQKSEFIAGGVTASRRWQRWRLHDECISCTHMEPDRSRVP